MTYKIKDINGNVVKSGSITVQENWIISDLGLVVGYNQLVITTQTKNGKNYEETVTIINTETQNMEGVDVDLSDNDNDGLKNYYECVYGTDQNKEDTDGDGLSDYFECIIIGTNALEMDSDNNGINDGEEDFDGDGLSNKKEMKFGTDLTCKDTDGDGLSDAEEIDLDTNPLMQDTDSDGMNDLDEYLYGFDMLKDDANDIYVETYLEEDFNICQSTVAVSVKLEATAKQQLSFSMDIVENDMLDETIPGYIGEPFDFDMDGDFVSAEVTMTFEQELLNEPDFTPCVYYYNEDTQMLEEVEEQVISGNSVILNLKHFSTYILLNKAELSKVWEEDILAPNNKTNKLRVAFAIDVSSSMNYDKIDAAKQVLTKFVEEMPENAEAALIKFNDNAIVVNSMTSDKTILTQRINSLGAYGLTAIYKGIETALNELLPVQDDTYNILIVLTDGYDVPSVSYDSMYKPLIEKAKNEDISIFTVGISTIDEKLLQRIANETNGKFYYAQVLSDLDDYFEEIEEDSIDYITDSNEDGISDYYTKLLCEGKLRTGTGKRVFGNVSYNDVQQNNDYDGDGIKNGSEIVISSKDDKVYVKVKSNPMSVDSDMDSYTDSEEVFLYGTSPIKQNLVVMPTQMDLLLDDTRYVSDKYKEIYKEDWLEKTSIWIGNNIFGTAYDQEMIYKAALVDYLKTINDGLKEQSELQKARKLAKSLVEQINTNIDTYLQYNIELNSTTKGILESVRKTADDLDGKWLTTEPSAFNSVDDYYSYCDDLYKQYCQAADAIPELEKEIKIMEKVEVGKKITGKFSWVLTGVSVVTSFQENYNEYCEFVADLDVMQKNIDILDVIIKDSKDNVLKQAALELKDALNQDLTATLNCFWESDYFNQGYVNNNILGTAIHTIIGMVPSGCYVELARGVLDFITNFSGVSYECVKVYAIASVSSILSKNFNDFLSAYQQTDYEGYHVSDIYRAIYYEPDIAVNLLITLSYARKASECQMKTANEANTWIFEWYFKEFEYNSDLCDINIEFIERLISKYIDNMQALGE